MSTRSGRTRQSIMELSPPRTRNRISPSRSPARTQKSSPTIRSSTRRSPSRKSPSRKTTSNYPARKSPSRTPKDSKEEKDIPLAKSPSKRPALKKDPQLKLEDISSKLQSFRSTRSRRLEYTVSDIPSTVSSDSMLDNKRNGFETAQSITDIYSLRNRKTFEDIAPRKSSRLRDVTDAVSDIRRSFTKSLSKSISKSASKSIDTFSDEENFDVDSDEKPESVTRKLSTPTPSHVMLTQTRTIFEFGGNIGSFALFLAIPLTIFAILLSCQNYCSHKSLFEISSISSLPVGVGNNIFIFIICQHILQAVFVLVPVLGSKEVSKDGTKICFNAFFSAVCTVTLVFLLDYYKLIEANVLLESTVQLAIVSYFIAIFVAIFLYFKSKRGHQMELNPYGVTGYRFYEFVVGREIHPQVMKLNIKLWTSRISNISTLLLALLLFKKGFTLQDNIQSVSIEEFYNIQKKITLKPTVLVFSLMQIVYALYFIIKEHKITSTFYWQYEGMGYLQIVTSALYPYYYTIISKHVVNADVSLKANTLIAASVLYGFGFLIMLISNNIKYEFRRNPLHPSLSHLDSMPTFHGKKLLLSNLWGILRHPNYTGDIMMHISLALPGILTRQFVAAAPALLTIVVLVHRSWRDHCRCSRRYGAAWNRYCKKVPSVLIPKII